MICQSGMASPGGRDRTLHQRHVAVRVDHDPLGLGPQGAGQKDVGMAIGLGVEIGILARRPGRPSPGPRRRWHGWARWRPGWCRSPTTALMSPAAIALNIVTASGSRLGTNGAPAAGPQRSSAKARSAATGHRPLARQAVTEIADVAAAHGVGLACQRERPAAGATDLAPVARCRLHDRIGVPGAEDALVQPHRPERHPLARRADHAAPRAGCRPPPAP